MPVSKGVLKDIAVSLIFLAVYFIAGKLGLRLAFVNASATAVWPPTGIALAALIIFGFRFWPAVLLGAFLVNFTISGGIATSLGIAAGNTAEAVLGAYLVNNFAAGRHFFAKAQDIFKFAFLAGVLATAVAATVGVFTLVLGGLATALDAPSVWLTWWLGDMGGALIFAPFFILWREARFIKWKPAKIVEGAAFLATLMFFGEVIFGGVILFGSPNSPLDFLCIPLLLWAVFRFERHEVSAIVLILSGIAVEGTLHGFGPFFIGRPNESLLLLQGFLITASIGSLAVAALIGERKKLQDDLLDDARELAEEKIKADALLASIGEAIIATDSDSRIILVNKAFEDLLGWKAAEVIGKQTNEAIFMEDEKHQVIPEKGRPLALAFSAGKKIIVTCYLVTRDKIKFPATVTSTPLIVEGKIVGSIEIFRDVTLEKQIDRAKSEFVSLASHQLRTPLTIIKWHASRLLNSPDFSGALGKLDKVKKELENIYITNERMIELVNAILNVSKIDLGTLAIEPRPSSLTAIADKLLEEFQPQIALKKLKIFKFYPGKLPDINLDPSLMRIVLQNLLSNAIKYTPPEGKITLKIQIDQSQILLSIADSGCGIPAEDQSKIFSKFFRTEPARQIDPNGNGLGMYIVEAILKETGGKVWFTSKVDKGTTFYVTLPLSGMKPRPGVKGLNETSA